MSNWLFGNFFKAHNGFIQFVTIVVASTNFLQSCKNVNFYEKKLILGKICLTFGRDFQHLPDPFGKN